MNVTTDILQFELPRSLACPKPTEERDLSRDDVRLLVTSGESSVIHSHFKCFADYLHKEDVLVVNTSATQGAAFPVMLPDGRQGVVHFSTKVDDERWMIEIREVIGNKTIRWHNGQENMIFELPEGGKIKLLAKYYEKRELLNLWVARFESDLSPQSYMASYGQPIQYENLSQSYPLEYYQTYFSFHPGSSEMPSAGRGFTQPLINKLLDKGVIIAPILLHTGVSSLEENEQPYPEYMEVDHVSASIVNKAKRNGNRIVAVGTTATRAIESATDQHGSVNAHKGYTDLYITADYQMKTINSLLTGFHEPRASHLHMLQSLAGLEHVRRAYAAAISDQYFWHQFGDLHLIIP